jgi:hypothetical protein
MIFAPACSLGKGAASAGDAPSATADTAAASGRIGDRGIAGRYQQGPNRGRHHERQKYTFCEGGPERTGNANANATLAYCAKYPKSAVRAIGILATEERAAVF